MRHIIIAACLATACVTPALAQGQRGEPRYFVKAWLQKADKSFEHTTAWCDNSYRCLVPVSAPEGE